MSDNLIFDIGANRGLVAEKFVNKGYKAICVEPLPDLCTLIEEKFSETESVTCVNAMVSSHVGSKEFFKGSADTLSTSSSEWMTTIPEVNHYQRTSLLIINLTLLIILKTLKAYC
jgi:FkbM family methyltransferase